MQKSNDTFISEASVVLAQSIKDILFYIYNDIQCKNTVQAATVITANYIGSPVT